MHATQAASFEPFCRSQNTPEAMLPGRPEQRMLLCKEHPVGGDNT